MFSQFSINKPIFTFVCTLVLLLVGFIGWDKLPLREYPAFETPTLYVQVDHPPSSPELIYKKITKPLEKRLMGLPGLANLTSQSSNSSSNLTLTFRPGENSKERLVDTKAMVFEAQNALPKEASSPRIRESNGESQDLIYLSAHSSTYNLAETTTYLEKKLVPLFKRLPGVAFVEVWGEHRIDTIRLKPQLMESLGLNISAIIDKIKGYKDLPAGLSYFGDEQVPNLLKGSIQSIEEAGEIIVYKDDIKEIKLKEIADVIREKDPDSPPIRVNGIPSVLICVKKQQLASPLLVSKEVRQSLKDFSSKLPHHLSLDIAHDNSMYIKVSLTELLYTIFEASVLVVLIIYFFLKSSRATLIPLITIPLSLSGTLCFLYLMGYSLNTMSFLALVLSIGMVVDDAIVVLESIYRHIEKGSDPRTAALRGSKEISFSVISMTITLICVFFPLLFFKGLIGSLFVEFGFTLSCCIAVSGYVALSSCACLAAYFLRPKDLKNIESQQARYQLVYAKLLRISMRFPILGLCFCALACLMCLGLYTALPKSLAPQEDRGTLILSAYSPGAKQLSLMQKHADFLDSQASSVPEVDKYFTFSNKGYTQSYVILKPWNERGRSTKQILKKLRPALSDYPLARCHAFSESGLLEGSQQNELSFVLTTSYEQPSLYYIEKILQEWIRDSYPHSRSHLAPESMEKHFEVNYEKLANYQISLDEIAYTLSTLYGGYRFMIPSAPKHEGLMFYFDKQTHHRFQDPQYTYITGILKGQKTLIPLSELLYTNQKLSMPMMMHHNGNLAFSFILTLPEDGDMQSSIQYFNKLKEEKLPSFYDLEFTGSAASFMEGNKDLLLTLLYSCIFVYLILAVLFENFKDPLIIIFTVPLALLGSMLTLKLAGSSWNFYSQIGMITLVGVITKHGILMVDACKKFLNKGLQPSYAVLEASIQRLRPILMTTFSTFFGALPFLFSSNAGSELRFDIGLSIIGGLILGTFLTLFIIPNICLFLYSKK